jgi:hypothetical protein
MKIMIMWFLNGLFAFLIMKEWGFFNIYIVVPVFTFFTVFLFIEIERAWLRESIFWTIAILLVLIHLHNKRIDTDHARSNNSSILVLKTAEVRYNGNAIHDSNILLLGDNPAALIHNRQSTIYADWNLALRHFGNLNDYENISNIYTNLLENKPDYILDNISMMPRLMERIPELKTVYQPSYDKKVYKRVK